MAIFKINTSWIKSVSDGKIQESFVDAWSNIINATRGSWGDITTNIVPNVPLTFQLTQGRFFAIWETELEGSQELTLPFEVLGITTIKIQYVLGAEVTSENTYILDNGKTINVDFSSGRKIVTIDGFARKV